MENIFTIVGIIVGAAVALSTAAFPFVFVYFIKDTKTRENIKKDLTNNKLIDWYRLTVNKGLTIITNRLGKPFSLKSYTNILMIAFTYPIIFYFLGYIFGASTKITDNDILPPYPEKLMRFFFVLVYGLIGVLGGSFWHKSEQIISFVNKKVLQILPSNKKNNFRERIIKIIASLVGCTVGIMGASLVLGSAVFVATYFKEGVTGGHFFIAAIISIIVGGVITLIKGGKFVGSIYIVLGGGLGGIITAAISINIRGNIGVYLGFCFIILLGIIFARIRGVSAGIVFFAFGFIFFLSIIGNYWGDIVTRGGGFRATAVIRNGLDFFILYFFILPIANSLMDFLSVGISLNLTKKAVQPKTTLTRFTGLILIDGIVALATLIGVALIIPVFIISFNNILSVSSALQFDWLSQAKIARDFPFTSGLTITLMLFSTLVPTFIHLVFSVFAFSFLPLGRNQILKILNKPESDNRQYAIIALWYTLAWPISCVITLCIFILIFHYLIPNIPIAETLYNLIIWIYPIALT